MTPCFWERLASFARCITLETECHTGGVLSKRIGPLSEDAIGYALERYDSQAVLRLGCGVARQLKRNGVFRSDWSRGRVVAAVDGIDICSSFVRFCNHCMEQKVTHLVEGEPCEETQYYHRICAATVVSSFLFPWAFVSAERGEGLTGLGDTTKCDNWRRKELEAALSPDAACSLGCVS